jgi:hypothetical protein
MLLFRKALVNRACVWLFSYLLLVSGAWFSLGSGRAMARSGQAAA